MRILYKFLCSFFILGCIFSLTALAPAGRMLAPIDSGNTQIDSNRSINQERRDVNRSHYRDDSRVINQYYYPYYSSPYYSTPYYSYPGYYGGRYQSHNAFPDADAADELFRQLSD